MSDDIRNYFLDMEEELGNQEVDYQGGSTTRQQVRDFLNTGENPSQTKQQKISAYEDYLMNPETASPEQMQFGEEMTSMRDYLGDDINAQTQDLEDMRAWSQGG